MSVRDSPWPYYIPTLLWAERDVDLGFWFNTGGFDQLPNLFLVDFRCIGKRVRTRVIAGKNESQKTG
jgi:hypothetical protein